MLTLYLSTLLTGDGEEPVVPGAVTLEMAKQHLEYEDDDRDALIQQYIAAAQDWVEGYTGKLLTRRTTVQRFDSCAARVPINVGPSPVIDSLTYIDSDMVEQTIDPTDYTVIAGRIYPASSFPSARFGIEATITAGYQGAVPSALISAQLLLIGHWFANRETVVTGTIATSLPFGAESLCAHYRSALI